MMCPSSEMLMRFALGQCPADEHEKVLLHLPQCATCREAVEDMRETSGSLSDAHVLFDRGHAEGRRKLLLALQGEPAAPARRNRIPLTDWIGGTPMRRRITLTGAGLLATAAGVTVAVLLIGSSSLLAEVAARVREVKTYSCRMALDAPARAGEPEKQVMKLYWKEPGSIRIEAFKDGRLVSTRVHPAGKPGMVIEHVKKSFRRVPSRDFRPGRFSPGHWVTQLANYSGEADADLGTRQIAGQQARGFQIDASTVEPDGILGSAEGGVMRVWADQKTRLPVLCEVTIPAERATVRFDEFQWDVALDDKLFQVTGPEGYTETTRPAKTDKEKEGHLVQAFRAYAEIMGGHYPKVKMIYGDVVYHRMRAKAGIPRDADKLTEEQIKSDAYVNLLKSTWGWFIAFETLRDNPDAAYFGKTVGPNDKDKVLLRWRLDDGRYRVMFGDLRFETVAPERLEKLESSSGPNKTPSPSGRGSA